MQSTDYSLAFLLAFLQLPDLVTDLFFCVRFFDTVRTNRTRELEMILVLQGSVIFCTAQLKELA